MWTLLVLVAVIITAVVFTWGTPMLLSAFLLRGLLAVALTAAMFIWITCGF